MQIVLSNVVIVLEHLLVNKRYLFTNTLSAAGSKKTPLCYSKVKSVPEHSQIWIMYCTSQSVHTAQIEKFYPPFGMSQFRNTERIATDCFPYKSQVLNVWQILSKWNNHVQLPANKGHPRNCKESFVQLLHGSVLWWSVVLNDLFLDCVYTSTVSVTGGERLMGNAD